MKTDRYKFLTLALVFCTFAAQGQIMSGHVHEKTESGEELGLPGANVYWASTTIGTSTDLEGAFYILLPEKLPAKLVISSVGFQKDTILIENAEVDELHVRLQPVIDLAGVDIVARERGTNLSTLDPINVETLNKHELGKAACCNISESFETTASVDVVESDAVSGSKKIRMLGLDGVYSQLQFENFPIVRGLGAASGLNSIPGTWVESIQITKGAGSVVNGHESITGQINLEFEKPDEVDKLFVNLYGNNRSRAEANVHFAQVLSEQWSSMLFLHGSNTSRRNDANKDGFLDMPVGNQINLFNRWKFRSEKRGMQIALKVVNDERTGGQDAFRFEDDFGTQNSYGIGKSLREYEIYMKNGFFIPNHAGRSVGFLTSASYSTYDDYFGVRTYGGEQKSAYANMIYQDYLGNSFNTLRAGANYRYDAFDEVYMDSNYTRTESVPGVFAEYTYNNAETVSLVAGIRGDLHNLYGFKLSPRVHFKYNFKPTTAFRLSAGKGFRTANVFRENVGTFVSSRVVSIVGDLLPEEAWNYGATFTHKFLLFGESASFDVDFFRTDFTNQVIGDMDASPQTLVFYNLEGKSYSNSFQADLMMEPVELFTLKFAYKLSDVKATYGGVLRARPLVPRHRFLANGSFSTQNDKWQFDVTANRHGKSRVPDLFSNPDPHNRAEYSEAYMTYNAQITRRFRRWEWYLGGENLTQYLQPNAIIAANDPFGSFFDASMIWGPVRGRIIYSGIRLSIN